MTQAEFEKYLSRKRRNRRIIEGIITVAFLVFFIVCYRLWNASAEVVIHDPTPFQPNGWETVEHNDVYLLFFIGGIIAATVTVCLMVSDLAHCRYKTVWKGEQYLTIYRGLLFHIVYVNGVEKGRTLPLAYANVVEVWLANRARATVSFRRTFWSLAHVSFSDNTASMDI